MGRNRDFGAVWLVFEVAEVPEWSAEEMAKRSVLESARQLEVEHGHIAAYLKGTTLTCMMRYSVQPEVQLVALLAPSAI